MRASTHGSAPSWTRAQHLRLALPSDPIEVSTRGECMQLGRLGVWTWLDGYPQAEAVDVARRIEAWGYTTLWLPETIGRDPFALIVHLAAHTTRLCFATGIANIYARDAVTMRALQQSVGELSGGRFALGLGVSHSHLVTGVRGHTYGKPVATMRSYLDAMRKALYRAPAPREETPILIAALRTNMLRLAAEQASGAHPYLVTPEHTARARKVLGAGPWLAPEQMVLHESDPARARGIARNNLRIYLGLPNYQNNLLELGFEAADFKDGGSDHVCIQPFRPDGAPGPDLALLERLAG
jgi:probable F420-dependent oxidoreductase